MESFHLHSVKRRPRGARRARSRPWTGPRRSCLPESRTHRHVRHDTATLLAALEVATGKVTDACYQRHRHPGVPAFLKQVTTVYARVALQVVCDSYAAHKRPAVTA
jgi:hypothetical protein